MWKPRFTPAIRRPAWIALRFLLVSLAAFLLWPWVAPGYVRLVGLVMLQMLRAGGFDATLLPAAAGALRYEITHGGSRGVVSPFSDPGPLLLNMITLLALFSGALVPPRLPGLRRLALAAVALLLLQSVTGVLLTLSALPEFGENGIILGISDLLFAARSFAPILLWLAFDSGARRELITRLRDRSSGPRAVQPPSV